MQIFADPDPKHLRKHMIAYVLRFQPNVNFYHFFEENIPYDSTRFDLCCFVRLPLSVSDGEVCDALFSPKCGHARQYLSGYPQGKVVGAL
jgi:hypothetical protein